MKKLLFPFILWFSLLSALAQEKSKNNGFANKDIYVSGTFSYLSKDYDDDEISSFTFAPAIGYFVSNKTSLELGLLFGSSENEYFNIYNVESKITNFGAGLGIVHFFNPEKKFSFTFGGAITYSSLKAKYYPRWEDGTSKITVFGVSLSPGVNYFISKNIALRASLGAITYLHEKADAADAEAIQTFNINLNLSNINFGILYRLQ